MTGSGWASPSGEPANPGSSGSDDASDQVPAPGPADGPSATPPYYQPLPDGSQGWGTPALLYGAPAQPPYGASAPPPYGSPPPPPYGSAGPAWNEVRPGVAPLRPLTTGELLDGAFTTVRRYWRAILLPGAVLSVIGTLLDLVVQSATDRPGSITIAGGGASGTGATFLVLAIASVIGFVASSLAAVVIQRGILGQPITAADVWEVVRPRFARILGVAIVATALWLLATVLIVLPGIYVYVGAHFACVVLTVEGGTVRESIRRSFRVVKGAWWRTFGLMLLVSIIAGVIGGIISAPFIAVSVGSVLRGSGTVSVGAQAVADIGGMLAGIITIPFVASATALIYVDRRMRDEGLDVALRQAAGA